MKKISIEQLSTMFANLRTATNILSGEVIGFEDHKERIAISKANKEKLDKVYSQVDTLVDLQAQHLSIAVDAQPSLFDEKGEAIQSGYTKEKKVETSKAEPAKKPAPSVIGPEKPENKNEEASKTDAKEEQEKKEVVSDAKKPEAEPIKRLESASAAKEVIINDIIKYVKTNNFSLKKGNRLPMDLRTSLCIKLQALVPEDDKLAKAKDSQLKSAIGNYTSEVKNIIAKERMTDGDSVASEDKVAEKLAEEVKRDEIKSEQEKKDETAPAEKPTKEPETTPTEEPAKPVETPAEEKTEEEKDEKLSKEGDEAEIMAQLIQEQIESLKTSSDKETIKTAMKDIFVTQESRDERKAMSDDFSAILNKRTELFPDENDVYQLIVEASYAAKDEREALAKAQ